MDASIGKYMTKTFTLGGREVEFNELTYPNVRRLIKHWGTQFIEAAEVLNASDHDEQRKKERLIEAKKQHEDLRFADISRILHDDYGLALALFYSQKSMSVEEVYDWLVTSPNLDTELKPIVDFIFHKLETDSQKKMASTKKS
jgi:hypothetical protein